MNRIKVVSEPAELVPILRAVDTEVKRDAFKEVSTDWRTLKQIEEKFGKEGVDAITFFEKMKLVETKWQTSATLQPEKAYHAFYSSFHINATAPVHEISDVLYAAMMPEKDYAKIEKQIFDMVGEAGRVAGGGGGGGGRSPRARGGRGWGGGRGGPGGGVRRGRTAPPAGARPVRARGHPPGQEHPRDAQRLRGLCRGPPPGLRGLAPRWARVHGGDRRRPRRRDADPVPVDARRPPGPPEAHPADPRPLHDRAPRRNLGDHLLRLVSPLRPP